MSRRIPVDFRTIVETARDRLLPDELGITEVAARLEALFTTECGAEEEEIKAAYAPLRSTDPAADQRGRRKPVERPAKDGAHWKLLLDRFGALLERANYERLSRDALEGSAKIQGIPGLRVNVDFSSYDRLVVFVRGSGEEVRHHRRWLRPWSRREVRVPTHERVVLLARLETEEGLHVKLFRDIPGDDLEALLPGTKFRMRLFDHLRIGGAGGTAVFTAAFKAWRSTALARKLPYFLGPVVFPVMIGLCIFYALKTVWGYFRAKDKYRARLMTELFYQMLDSDIGVITRIVDEAEDEEAKETFLAWAVARHQGPSERDAIARGVESLLKESHGCEVQFDLPDALAKLERYRLAYTNHDGKIRVAPAGVAAVRLAAVQVRLASGT